MVFPGVYGFFGGIGAVEMRWDQLVIYAVCMHAFFETCGTFIVELLEDGS